MHAQCCLRDTDNVPGDPDVLKRLVRLLFVVYHLLYFYNLYLHYYILLYLYFLFVIYDILMRLYLSCLVLKSLVRKEGATYFGLEVQVSIKGPK